MSAETLTSTQTGASPRMRLVFLDNLRVFLTILVIFHHGALAYGGSGSWGIKDPAVDNISPIFLTFFNGVNQSYFMSAFFLLAGYFTPSSFERKGTKEFIKDRLIRLAIPILVYTTIILNFTHYIIASFYLGAPFHLSLEYDPGHLWFLQALLVFALLYVLFRSLSDRNAAGKAIQVYSNRFPPDAILFLTIGVLTILTFAVRIVFPVGIWFLSVQPGHFVHYTFCFFVGVLAYRGDWFRRLSRAQAIRWGIMSLVVIPFLFVIAILEGVLQNPANVDRMMGGLNWASLAYSAWESFLCIGIIVFLIYLFRERFNQAGSLLKSMAVNVFTVYIIHQTILFSLNIVMLPVNIPTIIKFFVVSIIAVVVCFSISPLIRKIPYANQVLG